MDLSKLSIQFLQGYDGSDPLPDGYTQKNKLMPHFSVVYPLEGYYQLSVEGGELHTVPPDGCFLMPPGVRHTLVHRSDSGFLLDRWLCFSVLYRNVLDVTGWFRPPLFVTGEEAQPFKAAVDALLVLPGDPYAAAFEKLRIAGQLLEALLKISDFQPAEPSLERIFPAMTLVRDRFDRHLSVLDLARACGMSESAFYRTFRQLTRKTPMEYLTEHRLMQAAQKMMQENATLSAIAAQCGFCDEFHLSRCFKQHYGVSPREYKKRTVL